jgi:dihydrofolate reductase
LRRVTYEGFVTAWPSQSDEAGFADRMNALPKYVESVSAGKLEWNNAQRLQGNLAGDVTRLKQVEGIDILAFGSAALVCSLMKYNLIDEYRLLNYPVVLGSGKRLFAEGKMATLNLVETQAFASGVVGLTYRSPGE